MDLMILNNELDAIYVIDTYESFIWTDRYCAYGDFELYSPMREGILENLKLDYYIQNRISEHTMIIEKTLISSDVEKGNTVTITGRSLESILDRRIIWGQKTLSGNLQNGIKELITESIINPSDTNRKIDNIIFEDSTDTAITELTLDAQYNGDNLYDVVLKICDEKNIGFKMILDPDSKVIKFTLYSGTDRSYDQTAVPYVIFSPKFDNLRNSNYVESNSSMRNLALVGGEGEGSLKKYATVGGEGPNIASYSSDFWEEGSFFGGSGEQQDYQNAIRFKEMVAVVPNTIYGFYTNSVDYYIMVGAFDKNKQYVGYLGKYNQSSTAFAVPNNAYYLKLLISNDAWSTPSNQLLSLIDSGIIKPFVGIIYHGMNRREMYVDANDISSDVGNHKILTTEEYQAVLKQRGNETLAENKQLESFEGEIETDIMFKYGVDFFDGDIVQIANEYGNEATVRIVEIVISEDETGRSVYPTYKTIT